MERPTAIYPRIFIPFVLTLGIGSLAAWWLASSLFASNLQAQREAQLTEAIRVLAQGNLPLTPDLLSQLGRVLQANLYLVAADGKVTPGHAARLSRELRKAIEQAWQERATDSFASFSYIEGQHFSILIQPLGKQFSGRYAAIAAVAGLDELRQASRQMAWQLGLGAILGGLLLAWLVHRIARGITTPINQLSQLAARIAAGDLEARVVIDHPRELAELGDSLNRMAAQLQRYQAEIAEQNRLQALGEMAARIAHEIRNPLTAIKLQLQLLMESLEADELDTANALFDEVRRLELIVDSTLQGAEEQNLRLVPVDLNRLVEEVIQLFQPQLAHRSIDLESQLVQPLPQALLDPDRIKQILVNLLVNAADALKQGGKILVSTAQDTEANRVTLTIDDSGPGIPEMQWGELFSGSGSQKPGGLGIGLRLSQQLVKLQGGYIEVDRSPLGGARFRLHLPLGNSR